MKGEDEMLKKSLIIAVAAIVVISTTVLAANIIVENNINNQIDEITSVATVETQINKNLEISAIKNAEEFKSIIDCCDEAKYENICEYVSFLCENSFDKEEIKIINRILEKGTTIQSLKQVHEFWLSTDEDFSIIEEICELEDVYFSEFWYEDAFNRITNDVHGVLSSEDIEFYQEKGVSIDEMLSANVLCRKEGQNIFDILDRVSEGERIEKIAEEIYDIANIPDADTKHEKVKMLAKAKKYKISSGLFGSKKVNLSDVISQIENSYLKVIKDKINAEIKRLEISKPKNSLQEEQEILDDIDLPISMLNALTNKGYTLHEIQIIPDQHKEDIYDAVKAARRQLKDEK